MLVSGGLLLHIHSHLDPLERAFGIAHTTVQQTEITRLYSIDNLSFSDFTTLQSFVPEGLTIQRRDYAGLYNGGLAGLLAIVFFCTFRNLLVQGGAELRAARGRSMMGKLSWFLALTMGLMLGWYQIPVTFVCFAYCILAFRLATIVARRRAKVKVMRRTLGRLSWVGLVWFAQVAVLAIGQHSSEAFGLKCLVFAYVALLCCLPTLRLLPERIHGNSVALKEAIGQWSSCRFWLLTLALSTGILKAANGMGQALAAWTDFLVPLLALWAIKGLVSCLRRNPDPNRRWVSSVFRILACSWLPLGLFSVGFMADSLTSQTVQFGLIGWTLLGTWLILQGRPWGSRVGTKTSSLGPAEAPQNSKNTVYNYETDDQSIPAPCALVLGILSVLAPVAKFLPSLSLGDSNSLTSFLQKISQSQIRTLSNGDQTLIVTHDVSTLPQGALEQGLQQVSVMSSWPEHLGALLLAAAGLLVFSGLVQWANYDWDVQFRQTLSGECLPMFGGLYGAYALAGLLGWHWYPPAPFAAIYVVLLMAPTWTKWVPLRDQSPLDSVNNGFFEPLHDEGPPAGDSSLRDAMGIEVVVGDEVGFLIRLDSSGLKELLSRLTGSSQPEQGILEPNLVHVVCDGVLVRTMDVRDSGDLDRLGEFLLTLSRERARRLLTYDNTQSWLEGQSEVFPLAAEQVRRRVSIGTLQAVLRRLVEAGSLLEDPEAILDVLATESGDEERLTELCLERMEKV
jgi:hypothetical protein